MSGLALALDLRPRRLPRARGRPRGRHRRHDGAAAHPAVRAADRARHRAPRRRDRAGELRAGVRGARHRAADRRAGRSPSTLPDGPGVDRARRRALRVPVGRQGVARLAGGGRRARRPGRRRGAARRRRSASSRARWWRSSGTSGAGKSTIASLVPRLYDVDAGSVRLGGVDVRDLSFADDPRDRRRGHPGRPPVPRHDRRQPPLRPPRTPPTRSCGRRSRSARLDDLVASLPDGLDTVVGERGYRLSGGERQRLTIARLLLAQPRVVILDEATAHLDSDVGGRRAGGARRRARRSHVADHRPPPVDDPSRRPDPRGRGRPDRRARHPRRSCSPPAAATPSSQKLVPPSMLIRAPVR